MTASTLTYPLDLIRTKLTVNVADQVIKPSIRETGASIIRANGVAGLYKGLPTTLAGITPYVAIKMTSFDLLKTNYGVDRRSPYFSITNLLMGGLAGVLAVTITYPTDLLRRTMQLSGTPGYGNYSTVFHATANILSKEGPRGLYKGYTASLLKVAPAMAILFWCNENLKSYLEE